MIVKDMGGPNRNELDLKVVPGPLDGAVGTRGIIKNRYFCCRCRNAKELHSINLHWRVLLLEISWRLYKGYGS